MKMHENPHEEIKYAYYKKVLFTSHALSQMNLTERMIMRDEVTETILDGDVIEEYLDDPRGKSYLICCDTKLGRTIHVVCAPKKDYLAIITAYIPKEEKWEADFRCRRK
ncbi:MAG TPA: DUF4258 domain-containing protein [Candidatus Methanoperedens sp.]|nr:DUF4258 domain-containing protein [Candidatus Methanoperedens sp.]HLB70889.1 DUF4258 domain-containing protein [Candidatus Methanoperedens sp.]